MFSIRLRIVLTSTLLFSIILLITFYITLIDISHNENRLNDMNIRARCMLLACQLESGYKNASSYSWITSLIEEHHNDFSSRLFTREGEEIPLDSLFPQYKLAKFKWDNNFFDFGRISQLTINGQKYKCYSGKVNLPNGQPAVLVTAISLSLIEHKNFIHFFLFFTLVPVFTLIITFVSYRLTKSAFKPVMKMIDDVKEITAAKLDKRLELPKSKDEIRTLGETLNNMISRIDDSFNSQKRFIADASHEIRTPLTIIQTELELASQHTSEPETKESIKISLSEIERLNSLTSSLLALARLDADPNSLNISPYRIDELLADCTALMQKAASEKKIEINLSIPETVTAEIDSEKIRRAVLNFIDNSIKYSDENRKIEIALKKQDSYYEIIIADNGFGIPADELPNIFKRFYRSNEIRAKIPGNGIGLSLADEIIKLHNGTIAIESTVNFGTTAVIRLPYKYSKTA